MRAQLPPPPPDPGEEYYEDPVASMDNSHAGDMAGNHGGPWGGEEEMYEEGFGGEEAPLYEEGYGEEPQDIYGMYIEAVLALNRI